MATSTISYDKYSNLENISQGILGAQDSGISTLNNVDLNTVFGQGNSYLVKNATNYPTSTSPTGRLYVIQLEKDDTNNVFQLYFPKTGSVYARRRNWSSTQGAFVWSNWYSWW